MILRKIISGILIVLLTGNSALLAAPQEKGNPAARNSGAEVSNRLTDEERLLEEKKEIIRATKGLDVPVDPDTYVIGPADVFVLSIRGQTQTEFNLRVLPEGIVILPNLGAFQAAGLTITEFRGQLFDALKSYYRNVEFDCYLLIPRSFVVYVLGAVKDPGAVELYAPFRAATALRLAGGITLPGSLREIELRENGRTVRTVDLFSFFSTGEVEENPVLREGQSLYVPVRTSLATVIGQVWDAGVFEIKEGETAADLVKFAGGITSYADTERILLESYGADGRVSVRTVSYDELDGVELVDQDVVVVPDRRSLAGNAFVRVFTRGGRSGKIYIEEGETLGKFIPRFLRANDLNDLTRAVIERRGEDGELTFIPVNLASTAGHETGEADLSFELHSGDVIAVPALEDKVYVAGEVVEPGQVEYQHGMPAERYVTLAGGPTSDGGFDKLSIYSSGGKKRKADRTSIVYPGDTIVVERKTSKIIGSAFLSLASLTGLALSIVAVTR